MCSIQVQVLNNFFYFPTFSNVKILYYSFLPGWRWFCFILLYQWEREEGHCAASLLSLTILLHPEIRCLSLGKFLHSSPFFPESHACFIVVAGYLNLPSRTVCPSFIKKKQQQNRKTVQDSCRITQSAVVMLTSELYFLCSIPGPKPQDCPSLL